MAQAAEKRIWRDIAHSRRLAQANKTSDAAAVYSRVAQQLKAGRAFKLAASFASPSVARHVSRRRDARAACYACFAPSLFIILTSSSVRGYAAAGGGACVTTAYETLV